MSVRVNRLKPFSLVQFAASIAGFVLDKLNFFFHFRGYPNRPRNPSLFNSAASLAGLVLDKVNFFFHFRGDLFREHIRGVERNSNQSLDTLISQIVLSNIWRCAAFKCPLNRLSFSRCRVPINSATPFFCI